MEATKLELEQKADLQTQISTLLSLASTAHARYEEEELGGRYDIGWASWYAHYLLQSGIEPLLQEAGREELRDRLESWLGHADASHRANAPNDKWEDFYARLLLEGD
jgi:hypothetical protein